MKIPPPELAQLHASEKRVLVEGNRVMNDEKEAAQRRAQPEASRREGVREANRQRAMENSEALREKWGASQSVSG